LLILRRDRLCKCAYMRDWTINYMLHILQEKNWSANRLATEAGVATSTVGRPIREADYAGKLSRDTVLKLQKASGIDPQPFIPSDFEEEIAAFTRPRPKTTADRVLEALDQPPGPMAQTINEIKIAVVGPIAQIVATVDRAGIAKLRQKLDAIESMLDGD
jgi:plasmid maintenance system antidote protein VapI